MTVLGRKSAGGPTWDRAEAAVTVGSSRSVERRRLPSSRPMTMGFEAGQACQPAASGQLGFSSSRAGSRANRPSTSEKRMPAVIIPFCSPWRVRM
jgi:hypothetical protein